MKEEKQNKEQHSLQVRAKKSLIRNRKKKHDIDDEIISMLKTNPSIRYSTIADVLAVAETTVYSRIKILGLQKIKNVLSNEKTNNETGLIKQKFQRPPATYSNPDYSTLYSN